MTNTDTNAIQGRALRQWIGPVSMVAAPLVFVVFLVGHHGISPLVGFRMLPALYVLCVAPGYLALRYIFRISELTPFESLIASLLLGLLITPGVWYALCLLGLSWITLPLCLGIAILLPLRCGWTRNIPARFSRLVPREYVPVLGVVVLLGLMWSMQSSILEVRDGSVFMVPHSEHALHVALITELGRHTPPTALPFLAGVDGWSYHYLPDVWCDLLRRLCGTDAVTAYYHLALPLRYVFLSLAAFLFLNRRFGRMAALFGMVCMLAFVEPAQFHFPRSWLTYLYGNYPTTFGIVTVFLILFCATLADEIGPRKPMLLAACLSGLLLWYKANYALAVGPAVAVLVTVLLFRARDFRALAGCLILQLALVALRFVDVRSASMQPTMVFAPFVFIEWWWGVLLLPESLKAWVGAVFAGAPRLMRWPAIFLICVLQRFHWAVIVALYLWARCGFLRGRARGCDLGIALIVGGCLFGLIVFPVDPNLPWNTSMPVWALISAIGFALMGPAVLHVWCRIIRQKRVVAIGCLIAVAALGVPRAAALRTEVLWRTRVNHGSVSGDFYAGCRFIERTAPANSLALHPYYRENFFVSTLTNRRSVLDYAWAWGFFCDVDPLLDQLDRFYAGAETPGNANLSEAGRWLAELGVTHVLAENQASLSDAYPMLRTVFTRGRTVVYEVTLSPQRLSTSWNPNQ